MRKKRIGASIISLLLLTMFLVAPGLAENASETIQVYVDGVLITPADNASGSAAPLLYEGTVYLPIWVLSEALGKPVEWDSGTNSLYIGKSAEIQEITVSTAEELVFALGSNRRILLEEGVYNLTTVHPGFVDANVYFGKKHDGWELFLEGIQNLTIEGAGDAQSEIIVEPRYANVLNFLNCSNISLVNIKTGHTEGGLCSGGVLLFENCADIRIDNTDMYGCGTIGLMLEKVKDIKVTGSTIYGCTMQAMSIRGSSNVLLENCVFRDNEAIGPLVNIEHTSGLAFNACSFLRNAAGMSMFNLSGNENLVIENTEFIDNNVLVFGEPWELSVDASNRFENNGFGDVH